MKLIILDRDGVINEDSDEFIKSPDEWFAIPGSLEAISLLKQNGWHVAVATNQSGISRGYFDSQTLQRIHAKMQSALSAYGTKIDIIVHCPHGPSDSCDCRKPKPGLYRQIANHFKCSLFNVPVIGDSERDLVAALEVKASPILVKTGKGLKTLANLGSTNKYLTYDNLYSAVLSLI